MQISSQESDNREMQITVKLTDEELKKYKDQAVKRIAPHVKVKGFRPGKAPAEAIIGQVGEPVFMQEVLGLAIPQSYTEAIKKEKIDAIARPNVEVKSSNPLEFIATVALMPEVKLKKVDKLKIKRNKIEVEKKELEGTLYEFQKYNSKYTDVNRAAKKGDRAELDFEGFDDKGVALDKTKSQNHPLVLGDNTFVPGFEENVIGMKVDDKKEFEVTFPKDYHREDFQNKKVKFKVELKRLEEMELAEINEDLSKKIIGKELKKEEFIEEIKKDILRQKQVKEDQRQQAELFDELLKHADIKMSDLLVEDELDYLIHQQKHEIENRGIKWEDFLKMMKEQNRDVREERKQEATNRVQARLIIREVVQQLKLEVSDEDVLAKLKEANVKKDDLKPTSQAFQQTKDQLLLQKIFDQFLEK